MNQNKDVLVVGSLGLVGSSLMRVLKKSSKVNKLIGSNRNDTDLFSFEETKKLIENTKPNLLIIAAAKVGGIHANNQLRAEFLLENLKINTNLLEA